MIPLFKPFISSDVDAAIVKTLHSGFIGEGAKVKEFEEALIPWVGRLGLAVNSCTSAITLALRCAGVGLGDEVITTPMTCVATNTPILNLGAIPVWSDVDPKTGNVTKETVVRALRASRNPKAILIVHWGGEPCDLDGINALDRMYGVPVIEDAAHAFGSSYKGNPIGSHSDFVCFSFQAIKQLTTGDGGLLTCKNPKDYERAKLLRWYGIDRNDPRRFLADISEAGYKFHMNDIAATIGLANLKHMPEILKKQPRWLRTLLVDDRDVFEKKMEAAGIQVSQVHGRNDKYTMFKDFQRELPGVDEFSKKRINVPCGWWLTEEEKQKIEIAIG